MPFFFREVAFYKTEGRLYQRDKRVASVDGYSDLDELFKRSISPEGEIVYYPVLPKETTDQREMCDDLTARYANGSTQTLTAEPYQIMIKKLKTVHRVS